MLDNTKSNSCSLILERPWPWGDLDLLYDLQLRQIKMALTLAQCPWYSNDIDMVNGPISYNLAWLHSSGTSAQDIVDESPQVTSDNTNLYQRSGKTWSWQDRSWKDSVAKHEAESPSWPHQMPIPLTLLEAQPARQALERHWSWKVNPCQL